MTKDTSSPLNNLNPKDFSQLLQNSAAIMAKYNEAAAQLAVKLKQTQSALPPVDPKKGLQAIAESVKSIQSEPSKLIELQTQYSAKLMKLMTYTAEKMAGKDPAPAFVPSASDHRFKLDTWSSNICFDLLKQMYLLNSEWLKEMLQASSVDKKTQDLASFIMTQLINAAAPTNCLATNPEAIQQCLATNGASLSGGLDNLLADIKNSGPIFDISRTDMSAFQVGENIACTPGTVVYKNEMLELIAYTPAPAPAGSEIHEIPLLIIPPCINRYYILDLSSENSFVKWLVSQGLSVFLISWVNPPAGHSDITFESYIKAGGITAIEFILKTFNKPKINLLGYCVGGTITATMLAYLAKLGKEKCINSASFLTTLTDFEDVGEMSVFIDEKQIDELEQFENKLGYFDGGIMSLAFSMLKSNDTIWHFVVNNYLLGKKPLPWDIQFWNAHPTRLSAQMHIFYLRNMYLENNLSKPNKMVIDGTPIDLGNISVPCHFISTQEDHIAPWKSTYKAMSSLKCERTFTLTGSGHVAGIVNPPPGRAKYGYYVSTDNKFPTDPDTWLQKAKPTTGSWWTYWTSWVIQRSGNKIAAAPRNKIVASCAIEKAPGSYVKVV